MTIPTHIIPELKLPDFQDRWNVERATNELRWHKGRLQQSWMVEEYRDRHGYAAGGRYEWRDVPTDDSE